MNSIPANEIKRRGISAVDSLLKSGPVHVIKNNRPAYIITRAPRGQTSEQVPASVWALLETPSLARRTRKQIDAALDEERASWGDR